MEIYHSYRALIESTSRSIRQELNAVDEALAPFMQRALPADAQPLLHDARTLSKRARMELAHLTQRFYEGDTLFWQRAMGTGVSVLDGVLRRYVAPCLPRSRERLALQPLYDRLRAIVSTKLPHLSSAMDVAVRCRNDHVRRPRA